MFQFLFSVDGRINRLKLWMFALIVAVVRAFALEAARGVDSYAPLNEWLHFSTSRSSQSIFADWLASSHPARMAFLGAETLGLLIFCLSAVVVIKRLHDLDKDAWWIIPLWIVPQGLGGLSSLFFRPLYTPLAIVIPVTLVILVCGLWGFVQLFCYSGSIGENRFGPDPLGGPVINPFQGEKSG